MIPEPTALHPSGQRLVGRQRNDTSQFGEDGLVEALFEIIGETNRWCFEVGAADGLFFSNTKRLRDANWRAVLIEANPDSYKVLSKLDSSTVYTFNELVKDDSLDRILASVNAPHDLDFGVIDIDGQDYWAWRGMERFKPRAMLVEYGYWNPPETIPGRDDIEKNQAGLGAICDLGKEKGYTALVSTYCNVLLVRNDAWESS